MQLVRALSHDAAKSLVAALLLGLFLVSGQDVPPPPRPKDDGPSVADTMKFLEEKLGGRVNYVVYYHNSTDQSDWTEKWTQEVSSLQAHIDRCRLTYHKFESRNEETIKDGDFGVELAKVQEITVMSRQQDLNLLQAKGGHPEIAAADTNPAVVVLSARWSSGDSQGHFFRFYDESLAKRLASALQHAVELCGGGSKDPF